MCKNPINQNTFPEELHPSTLTAQIQAIFLAWSAVPVLYPEASTENRSGQLYMYIV